MNHVTLEYGDVSLTAKNDLTASAEDKQNFSNLALLKQTNPQYEKWATLEDGLWILDGTFRNFPVQPANENFAYWSESMSNSIGTFTNPPVLVLSFSEYETSSGITLYFSTLTGDYSNNINVKWYRDNAVISDNDYSPDSATYFCENLVELYNKIEVTFLSTNNPYRYVKIENIVYGRINVFDENELRSAELFEDVSLTSEELKINTFDFVLNNKKNIPLTFQKSQPLILRRNDELFGTFFIEKAIRKSETLFQISAYDYIGVIDKIPFAGGTYTNVTVANLVSSILDDIPYTIDSSLANKTLSGQLEMCTKREALLQVVFAICAIVDTSRSGEIEIKPCDYTVKSQVEDGIYEGETFESEDEVTEIKLTLNNGTQVSKRNSVLAADVYDNVLEFSGVFINSSNYNEILNHLYNYYISNKNNSTRIKFIVENGEKIGDVIEHQTKYLGIKKGQISQMKINLNSNKLVAECELKDVV